MSNAPSTLEETTRLPDDDRTGPRTVVGSILDALVTPFRFAGFWSAVTLPLLYLPMLVGGLHGEEPTAFALLLAVHAVALVAGHGYGDD